MKTKLYLTVVIIMFALSFLFPIDQYHDINIYDTFFVFSTSTLIFIIATLLLLAFILYRIMKFVKKNN